MENAIEYLVQKNLPWTCAQLGMQSFQTDITFLAEGNLSVEIGWKYTVTITDIFQAAKGNVNYPGFSCLRFNI